MKTKKNNENWYILLIVGIVILIGSIAYSFYSTIETTQDMMNADDAYYATGTDQICYVPAQFITDSFASYEDFDDLQFYFVFDEYGTPYIVYMHDDTFLNYMDLYNYFYTDETDAPPIQNMYGKTVEIDAELESYAIDAYNDIFGPDRLDYDNFDYTIGDYYIDLESVSTTSSSYFHFNIGMLIGLVLFLIGLVNLLSKNNTTPNYQTAYATQETSANSTSQANQAPVYRYAAEKYAKEDVKYEQMHMKLPAGPINYIKGTIGALIGALIGAVVWVIIGSMGVISGWIAILMVYLAVIGFKRLGGGIDRKGNIIAAVISLILILPADFIVYALYYYDAYSSPNISFMDIIFRLFAIILYDPTIRGLLREPFIEDLIIGYALAIFSILIFFYGNKAKDSGSKILIPKYGTRLKMGLLSAVVLVVFLMTGCAIAIDYTLIGVGVCILGFVLFVFLVIKLSIVRIKMNADGFTYNDGKHKSSSLIRWSQIYSVTGPTSENICCIIKTKDHQEHLLNGSKFNEFEVFWKKINESVQNNFIY